MVAKNHRRPDKIYQIYYSPLFREKSKNPILGSSRKRGAIVHTGVKYNSFLCFTVRLYGVVTQSVLYTHHELVLGF